MQQVDVIEKVITPIICFHYDHSCVATHRKLIRAYVKYFMKGVYNVDLFKV